MNNDYDYGYLKKFFVKSGELRGLFCKEHENYFIINSFKIDEEISSHSSLPEVVFAFTASLCSWV